MSAIARDLLPSTAAALAAWRVLDTQFDAARFIALWQQWLAMAQRPAVLHVVAVSATAPELESLRATSSDVGPALADELEGQLPGLLPGQHRLSLQEGQLQLTLCIGELQAVLREQQFEADAVGFDPTQPWDRWTLKALARCCHRGAALVGPAPAAGQRQELRQAGFVEQDGQLRYDPPWAIGTRRQPWRTVMATPTTCAVVGAGLAGAAVAVALARRGWQVQVLDAAPSPAAGASGLPAGLLVPHVSADDSPRSRLTRAGLRLMRAEASRLLTPGRDWQASGVLERRLDDRPGLPPDWPEAGQALSALTDHYADASWHAGTANAPELWHAQAAWIKPARLVHAWLAHPSVRFVPNAQVHRLQREDGQWQLLDRDGQVLASAPQVVLANAADAARLLREVQGAQAPLIPLPALHELRGVVSSGERQPGDASALPPFPVNGLGSLIPAVPDASGRTHWYVGATYESADEPPLPAHEHHRTNLEKLRTLLPASAQALSPAFAPESARGWGGTRCASPDRLPLVGPLEQGPTPTLWISAAMGSRGLSFAMLCAELLAARLGAEPWPVEASLARMLHAQRRALAQDTPMHAQ